MNCGRPADHFNNAEESESRQDDAENPDRGAHIPWPGAVKLNGVCHRLLHRNFASQTELLGMFIKDKTMASVEYLM